MASAFKDRKGWIADFKPLFGTGSSRRRVRVPTTRNPRQYAEECDHYLRLLEVTFPRCDVADVLHAHRLKAITDEQREALLAGRPVPPAQPYRPLTIREAADLHPSTQRESRSRPEEYIRHVRELEEFTTWAGVSALADVTLDTVLRYVRHLTTEGYAYDGRRHRLLLLRRACRMGSGIGFTDPLQGLVLDRHGSPREIEVWTLPQLLRAAVAFQGVQDWRRLAVLALGGLMGLRPSEIIRARVGDLAEGVLSVGVRDAKTRESRRDLPVPEIIGGWLAPLLGRVPEAPFVQPLTPRGHPRKEHMRKDSLNVWFGRGMEAAVGVRHPVKALRKSFVSWADAEGLPERLLEPWLGHRSSRLLPVTATHYRSRSAVKELLPMAEEIHAVLSTRLSTPDESP